MNSSHWMGGKIKRICKQCGSIFQAWPSSIQTGGGLFCNHMCYWKWAIGSRASNWRGGKITRMCKQCGTMYQITPSIVKHGWGRFCSQRCFGKWYSENMVGSKAPGWKGGTSFESYGLEWTPRLKHEIKMRDGFCCGICHSNKCLHIHHINYDKKNNDPDNLITLCNRCHSRTNLNNRHYWTKILQLLVLQASPPAFRQNSWNS